MGLWRSRQDSRAGLDVAGWLLAEACPREWRDRVTVVQFPCMCISVFHQGEHSQNEQEELQDRNIAWLREHMGAPCQKSFSHHPSFPLALPPPSGTCLACLLRQAGVCHAFSSSARVWCAALQL